MKREIDNNLLCPHCVEKGIKTFWIYNRSPEVSLMHLLIAILFAAQHQFLLFQASKIPVRIVDFSKDLNCYGVGSVDRKERVESRKVRQGKNMIHVTHKYPVEGRILKVKICKYLDLV